MADTSIERFQAYASDGLEPPDLPDPEGGWVRYEDHIDVLAASLARARILYEGALDRARSPFAVQVQGGIDHGTDWSSISFGPSVSPAAVASSLRDSFDDTWIAVFRRLLVRGLGPDRPGDGSAEKIPAVKLRVRPSLSRETLNELRDQANEPQEHSFKKGVIAGRCGRCGWRRGMGVSSGPCGMRNTVTIDRETFVEVLAQAGQAIDR